MKRKLMMSLVALLSLCGLAAGPARAMDPAEVQLMFYGKYPRMREVIASVSETAIPGLFEMADHRGEVVYFSPATGHVLIGKIYDKDGQNIAEETKSRITLQRLQVFVAARSKAITVGSGPVEVIEITNPDCVYCRELSLHLDRNGDVTRRIFIVGEGDSVQKGRYVAAAPDKAKALREVMSGLYDEDAEFASRVHDDGGVIDAHLKLGESAAAESTPMVLINGKVVEGADLEEIDALIASAREEAARGVRGKSPAKESRR